MKVMRVSEKEYRSIKKKIRRRRRLRAMMKKEAFHDLMGVNVIIVMCIVFYTLAVCAGY